VLEPGNFVVKMAFESSPISLRGSKPEKNMCFKTTTLPETNIAPKNGWLEYVGIL